MRLEAEATVLPMLESRTAVQPAARQEEPQQVVAAGERVRLTAQGVEPERAIDAGLAEEAWRTRRLVVQDRPLTEVLDELARHRPGLLRQDRAQLQGLRVSAVLPLDDTDRALQLLLDSFPQLRVRSVTRWIVRVDAPPAP